jgi:hypothetical protein
MHIIRLRGPWQLEPVARFVSQPDGTYRPLKDDLPPSARQTMPADWSEVFGPDFLGRVRYLRVFQKPTGLDSGERVFLVVERPNSHGEIRLSGKRLGDVSREGAAGRFDITELLGDHNRLEIIVDHPALDARGSANDDGGTRLPGGLVGEVRLEIED